MSEERDDSSQLIGWGGDLLAGLAAAQMAIAHPGSAGLYEGAMIGSTLALSFRNIVPLFFGRAMARREQKRVGTVSVLTAVAIRKRLDNGERLREDGFFDRDATDRSKADEIAEAVLISAQREHEEKKLPYLANLLASIAFESRIDVGMANYIVKIASSLTYRQYCVLSLAVSAASVASAGLHSAPFPDKQDGATQLWTLLIEIFDLYRLQLVGFGEGFITEVIEMPLERLRLDTLGAYLHLTMKLHEIPAQDIAEIVALLR
jgi:hypothetical protein